MAWRRQPIGVGIAGVLWQTLFVTVPGGLYESRGMGIGVCVCMFFSINMPYGSARRKSACTHP